MPLCTNQRHDVPAAKGQRTWHAARRCERIAALIVTLLEGKGAGDDGETCLIYSFEFVCSTHSYDAFAAVSKPEPVIVISATCSASIVCLDTTSQASAKRTLVTADPIGCTIVSGQDECTELLIRRREMFASSADASQAGNSKVRCVLL